MHAKLLQSCPTVCNPMNCSQTGSSVHGDSPGRNTEVGCHNLLQGIPNTEMESASLMSFALKDEFFTTSATWKAPKWSLSCSVMSDSLQPHESQHARPSCPSPTPGVDPNSCPSSQWCHPAISSSVVPFSSCPQSLPASGSFLMSQLFTWGQSTGVSVLASFLPKKSQGWSSLGWTCWISLQSKRLSTVFSNTTVQKHQVFGT